MALVFPLSSSAVRIILRILNIYTATSKDYKRPKLGGTHVRAQTAQSPRSARGVVVFAMTHILISGTYTRRSSTAVKKCGTGQLKKLGSTAGSISSSSEQRSVSSELAMIKDLRIIYC